MTLKDEGFRFANTYCSQCGGQFGPGDEGFSHCSDHQRPALTALQIKGALIADTMDYGRATADELPKSQQMWLDAIKEKMALLENHAYAEGRKDEAEEHAWRPIETAPKDGGYIILGRAETEDCPGVSALGSWADVCHDAPDEMGHDAGWADFDWIDFFPGRSFGAEACRHAGSQPTHWMPLPTPPSVA